MKDLLNRLKFFKYFIYILPLVVALFGYASVTEASADVFQAGRIVEDGVFTNKDSMSESNVQEFLQRKNSTCLVNYQSPEPLGNGAYGGNASAARVIFLSAQMNSINPRVLLVMLQKETTLITTGDCSDWRYRTAMGFACPDGGGCNPKFYGFSAQVYQSARYLRAFYDNNPSFYVPYTPGVRRIYFHPNQACGYTDLNVENRATAALYSYTPYQPNQAALNNMYGTGDSCSAYGNRNFWRFFNDWQFNISRVIADNAASTGDYRQWLVDDVTGTRQYIPGQNVINAWGLDSSMSLYTMENLVLGSYRETAKPLGIIIRAEGGSAVHLVNGGKRFSVASMQALSQWGFSANDIADVTRNIGGLLDIVNLGMVLDDSQNQWLVDFTVNTRYYVTPDSGTAWKVSTDPGLENSKAPKVEFPDSVFPNITQGPNLNRVARGAGTMPVYVVDNGKRMRALSLSMLNAWGYNEASINDFSGSIIDVLQAGGDLSFTIKDPVNTNIYMVDALNGGNKISLRIYGSPDVLVAWEGIGVNHTNVTSTFMSNAMAASGDVLSTSKLTFGGSEYQAVSGQKLPMTSTVATLYPGVAENVSQATYARLVASAPVTYFARDSLGIDVYMIDADTKRRVNSPEVLRAWGTGPHPNVNIVSSGYLNLIPTGATLNTFEADVSGQLYLMDGRKIVVASGLDGGYRTGSNVYSPSVELMSLITLGENASNFLKGFNSVPIYLMDAGNLRHIRTPVDLSLMNNNETITSVSDYVLGQFSENAFVGYYVTNGSTKYVFNTGTKYSVDNAVATEWGLTSPDTLSAATISRFGGTGALTNLMRDSAGKIYLVNQGEKRHILGPSVFQAWGFSEGQVVNASDVLVNTLPTGYYLDVLAKSSASPAVYKLENGQKRHILSPEVLQSLGYSYSMVSVVSSTLLDSYAEGSPIS